jgi:hypothetical protein
MLKETTVTHKKGQKHSGKSNWDKLIHRPAPVIDEENPELAGELKVKFVKPEKVELKK